MDFVHLANTITNGEDAKQVYADSHASLMSHMVQVGEFIDRAIEVEQCDVLGLEYFAQDPSNPECKHVDIHDVGSYALQYPYTTPCRPEYVDLPISDITSDIANDWIQAVERRISPFLSHSIRYDDVIALDIVPKLGIIVHAFSGTLQVFDYTELSELVVTTAHSALAPTLNNISCTGECKRHIDNYVRKYKMRNEFMLFYTLRFRTDDGDGFQENNSTDVLFPRGLSHNIAKNWGNYLLNCVKEKSHIIMLP